MISFVFSKAIPLFPRFDPFQMLRKTPIVRRSPPCFTFNQKVLNKLALAVNLSNQPLGGIPLPSQPRQNCRLGLGAVWFTSSHGYSKLIVITVPSVVG